MAKHEVICPKCKEKFDTNKEDAVKVAARRYGHARCYPEIKELLPKEVSTPQKKTEDPNLTALKDYINQVYKDKANWVLITKQIKDFIKKGYTYSGILSTLKYIYEVQHNSVEKSNGGIGLVDYLWDTAKLYYYKIYVAQQKSEEASFTNDIQEIYISIPIKKNKIKLMDMDWEEDIDNG